MTTTAENSAATKRDFVVTTVHGYTWTTSQGRIQTLRARTRRVSRDQYVRVEIARRDIGVRRGDQARVCHIMEPDRKADPYAGHVLVLYFENKPDVDNRHFFSLSEVTPLTDK